MLVYLGSVLGYYWAVNVLSATIGNILGAVVACLMVIQHFYILQVVNPTCQPCNQWFHKHFYVHVVHDQQA